MTVPPLPHSGTIGCDAACEVMMQTLQEFNRKRERFHAPNDMNAPLRNGIACPKCEQELMDSSPMVTLTSNPPKKNIHCAACGFTGFRIA